MADAMGIRSWWNRVRGGRATAPSDGLDPSAAATHIATTRVSDRLVVHEWAHAYHGKDEPIAVRTFITEGLEAMGATEVRATVPADWTDAALDAARKILVVQEGFAADGKPAVLGGFTGFRSPPLAGDKIIGVTYARGMPVPGIPRSATSLVTVLLHADELAIAERGLATRILGLLAFEERLFPYPWCWTVRATPVLTLARQEKSLIERAGYLACGDTRVTIESAAGHAPQTIVISLPPDAAPKLASALSEPADARVLALVAKLSPNADGQQVWGADGELRATTCGGEMPRRMGATFVVIGASEEDPATFRRIEDGVAFVVSAAQFDRVRDALTEGRDLTMTIDDAVELVVEHRRNVIVDPFTGAATTADWERYRPNQPAPRMGRVSTDQIVLLNSEEQLAERIETPILAAEIKRVQEVVERLAGEQPVERAMSIAVGLTYAPGTPPKVQLAFGGGPEPMMLESLHYELTHSAPVAVRGEVAFRIELKVHPHPIAS
jgi:hypothetical protein